MNIIICLSVLTLFGWTSAQECVGFYCGPKCADDEYLYTTGCGYLTREATCTNPNPQPDTGAQICDYAKCYCKAPKVRNEKTKKCVHLRSCPRVPVCNDDDGGDRV